MVVMNVFMIIPKYLQILVGWILYVFSPAKIMVKDSPGERLTMNNNENFAVSLVDA